MAGSTEIITRYQRLRAKYADRDRRFTDVQAVLAGRMVDIYPDLFPETGFSSPIVANMVEISARDISEVIAPLPTVTCSSASMASDRARMFADKRTKIAAHYVFASDLQRQMYTSAYRYGAYGMIVGQVEVDEEAESPVIRMLDPVGIYPLFDRFNRTVAIYQRMLKAADDLAAEYPEWAHAIVPRGTSGQTMVEVVRYHDKDGDLVFLPSRSDLVIDRAPNLLGKVMVRVAMRASIDDVAHGQFDDVLAVQLAKAKFALLSLEAAQKSVQAPISMPQDVQELSLGPDAVLRSSQPNMIRRVPLEIPQGTFQQQAQLDSEIRQGSRYPEARSGNVDASVITGRGVQALMSGFDTQVKAAQALYARVFTDLLGLCFELDEAVFPNVTKTVRGNDNGTPYEIKYRPIVDINGDHTVDVQYGLMAGLDPNRALVFALQARGDKLISRNFVMSQLPFSLNIHEEEQKIDIEEMRDALKQAVAGYAQAIPVLAENGQDPGEVLQRLSQIIQGRQKGRTIEALVSEAFAPQVPPEGAAQSTGDATGGPPVPGQAPSGGAPPGPDQQGGQVYNGLNANGLMRGVAAGQAGMNPGGRPDMQTLLAGLSSSGQPNMSAAVARRMPV